MRSLPYIVFLLFLFSSCTGFYSRDLDKTFSENTVLKRKASLLERENGVIRKDNSDITARLKIREAALEKAESDYAAFKVKHDEEIALMNSKFDNFKKRSDLHNRENENKIDLLMNQNAALEKTLSEKVKALSGEIRSNSEKYNAERAKMKQEAADREFALIKVIENQKSTIESRDREISELKDQAAALKKQFAEKESQKKEPEKNESDKKEQGGQADK